MKKVSMFLTASVVVSLMLTASSCKKKTETVYVDKIVAPAPGPPTLYTRLGSIAGITLVVDRFITNCATNSLIGPDFAMTAADAFRLKYFRANLIDQLCQAAGGPCTYKGLTMLEAHQGQNVTDADFDMLVAQLVESMTYYNVPSTEQGEVAAALLPMRPDIVGH